MKIDFTVSAYSVELVNLRSFSTIPELPLYILHQKSRFLGIFVDINKKQPTYLGISMLT